MLELILGQIPEAIFFSLFMIYAKELKEKRVLFTTLMVAEYLLLKHFISFNVWFQILYTFITFIILKILYEEKAQVTDIFTFTIASIITILCSIISFIIIMFTLKETIIASILCKALMFLFIFMFRKKLYNITKIYKNIWNRNNNKTKIKSTTFRSINIILFNIIFYLINLGMLFTSILKGGA